MNTSNNGWAQDFDALSRQYWNAWSDMASQSGGQASQANAWKQTLDLWAPWARDGRASIDGAVERMNAQAGDWLGKMQDLAQSFAKKQASPADVAKAWKDMLGASGNNPFASMLAQGAGPGTAGVEQWMQQTAPMWESWQAQLSGLFNMPAFGPQREQQERWQALMKARMDYQQAMAAYAALLMGCGKRAFAVFESKLAERSEPGRQIDTARGLFDLWIDSAEEAWAELALSAEYRRVYGEMTNAQMRVRAAVQDQIERIAGQFGMPTRTEVNSSHRKVTQLERDVRDLKQRLAALEANAGKPAATAAVSPAKAVPAARAPAKPSVNVSKAGNTVAAKSATAKPTAAKPAPAAHKSVKPAKRR
jgi:class III poly(R)-hydroxyalkanoic acid synthase PhaE subunit